MVGIICYVDMYLVMDEVFICCVLDVFGCLFLVWDVIFDCDKVGEFDIELFEEFFCVFVMNVGIMFYIVNFYGLNCYYIVEICFKVVVRILCKVIEIDLC